ncbi:MAG: hypothetical protein R2857_10980 [Vampirovibrionales bacterium]
MTFAINPSMTTQPRFASVRFMKPLLTREPGPPMLAVYCSKTVQPNVAMPGIQEPDDGVFYEDKLIGTSPAAAALTQLADQWRDAMPGPESAQAEFGTRIVGWVNALLDKTGLQMAPDASRQTIKQGEQTVNLVEAYDAACQTLKQGPLTADDISLQKGTDFSVIGKSFVVLFRPKA